MQPTRRAETAADAEGSVTRGESDEAKVRRDDGRERRMAAMLRSRIQISAAVEGRSSGITVRFSLDGSDSKLRIEEQLHMWSMTWLISLEEAGISDWDLVALGRTKILNTTCPLFRCLWRDVSHRLIIKKLGVAADELSLLMAMVVMRPPSLEQMT